MSEAELGLQAVAPETVRPDLQDGSRPYLNVTTIVAIAGLVFGLVSRLYANPQSPLWFDETFAAAVATASDLRTYFRLMGEDVNGPLYYLMLRPWVVMFGTSNAGLRSMSTLLSASAPLIVLIKPIPGMSRDQRLTWAAMVALWIPAIGYAQAAKPLALAFVLATVQLLAYVDLMRHARPSIRTAAVWVGCSCLAIEAHYDVAYIPLVQGIVYLAVRRRDAVRTWPALLLLVPVVAEIGRKLPILIQFTSPGTTWYAVVRTGDLPTIAAYAFGGMPWLWLYPCVFLAFAFLGRNASVPKRQDESQDRRALAFAGLSSALALSVFVAVGSVRAAFAVRYLGPFAPGLLLCVVLVLGGVAKAERRVAYPFVITAASLFVGIWLSFGAPRPDSGYDLMSVERPVASLIRSGVREVVFTLDNPIAHGMPDEAGRAVPEFFFRRAHVGAVVQNLDVTASQDPNATLLRAAAPHGAAIMWMYDKSIAGTAAKRSPPRIDQLDPHYACHNFGQERAGVVACVDTRYSPPLAP